MSKPDAAALQERNQEILTQRMSGDSLAAIGSRFGLSAEAVRLIVARVGNEQIDDLAARMRANVGTDSIEAFLIPGHGGEDFQAAMTYFLWAQHQLTKRGIKVKVHYRPVPEGVVFGIEEDVSDYGGST